MSSSYYLGILFAFSALVSWGFGDFFIQKTTRTIGVWKALFFIGIVAFFALLPFVKEEIVHLLKNPQYILSLSIVGVIVLISSLFDFEALKEGKMAVVEPLIGIELPLTVGLSMLFLKEDVKLAQLFLIVAIFIGIVLAVTQHRAHLHYHKRIFEKGVMFAGITAFAMAETNFLVGVSSQTISPLVTIDITL